MLCKSITQGKRPIYSFHIASIARQNIAVRVASCRNGFDLLLPLSGGNSYALFSVYARTLLSVGQLFLCGRRRGAKPRFRPLKSGISFGVSLDAISLCEPASSRQAKTKRTKMPPYPRGFTAFIALPPSSLPIFSPSKGSIRLYISISSIICTNGVSVKFSALETSKKYPEHRLQKKNCRFNSNDSSDIRLFQLHHMIKNLIRDFRHWSSSAGLPDLPR